MKTFTFLLLAFAMLLALVGCDSSSKWRSDMPDNGTMLCSESGEGFVVINDTWGFRVDRYHSFDAECAQRMK